MSTFSHIFFVFIHETLSVIRSGSGQGLLPLHLASGERLQAARGNPPLQQPGQRPHSHRAHATPGRALATGADALTAESPGLPCSLQWRPSQSEAGPSHQRVRHRWQPGLQRTSGRRRAGSQSAQPTVEAHAGGVERGQRFKRQQPYGPSGTEAAQSKEAAQQRVADSRQRRRLHLGGQRRAQTQEPDDHLRGRAAARDPQQPQLAGLGQPGRLQRQGPLQRLGGAQSAQRHLEDPEDRVRIREQRQAEQRLG